MLGSPPDPPVLPGDLYNITGNWNGAATASSVRVLGIDYNRWASTGWVLDANGDVQAVTVDVEAQAWELPKYGNDFIRGDATGNIIIGSTTAGNPGTITSPGNENLLNGGDDNLISGGSYNTITGGSGHEISGGTNNSITGGAGCVIEAGVKGNLNTIIGSVSSTVPGTCNGVTLINCLNFTPPVGDNLTYVNNQPTGTGGGPLFDVYGATPAKENQVAALFTSASQYYAADVALSGDTSTGYGSIIYNRPTGVRYELAPDKATPLRDAQGNLVLDAQGNQQATPTWYRQALP